MKTILLISPYWKEPHRWMVSSVKLAELWQRMGYRIVVVCMGQENRIEERLPTLIVHFRKDVFVPDPWNYGIALGFSHYVRRVSQEEQPHFIIVNKLLFWSSLVTLPLRLSGRKVIVLTDALVGMTWWPRGLLPRIGAVIYAWTFGWLVLLCAHRIVFFHPQSQTLLKRLGIAKKSQVIPTGIDEAKFEAPSPEGEGITVTYIGRLESVKGVDDFLAALVPLKKDFPLLKIRVVGWYKGGHPLVSQYLNDVEFMGLRDDIPAILASTDVFVLPSYSEGLSNALMEAMASACACIATDVGGNRFLIENAVSGFLFPPGDRAMLERHVRRLIEDSEKRRQLGKNARKRIEEVFSWRVIEKEYAKLFADVLAQK